MLRNLRIPLSQKIGLAAIFVLATGDIVIEIPRTIYAIDGTNLKLSIIWSMLEAVIAVIVCGLPPYRGLFTITKRGGTESQRRAASQYYEYSTGGASAYRSLEKGWRQSFHTAKNASGQMFDFSPPGDETGIELDG